MIMEVESGRVGRTSNAMEMGENRNVKLEPGKENSGLERDDLPKKEEVLDASGLPEGWTKKVTRRQTGASAGKCDIYYISPTGKRFRSRVELQKFAAENNLDFDLSPFSFSPGGGRTRRKPINMGSPSARKESPIYNSAPVTKIESSPARGRGRPSAHADSRVKGPRAKRQKRDVDDFPLGKPLMVKFDFPLMRRLREEEKEVSKDDQDKY